MLPIMLELHGEHARRGTVSHIHAGLRRLGPRRPRLVAQRSPYRLHDHIRAGLNDDGSFTVEYLRPGRPEMGALVPDIDGAARLFTDWAQEEPGWADGHEWSETGFVPAVPAPVSPEQLPLMQERLRQKVDEGFLTFPEIVDHVAYSFTSPFPGIASVQAVLDPIWNRRAAEQLHWPEETDCRKLTSVFEMLRDFGVMAMENFTCCMTCGTSEIRDHATGDHHGYAFYHIQDTEAAVFNGNLHIAFGAFRDTDPVEVGNQVVNALNDRGLSVEWNGKAGTRILVTGLTWQRRLR